MVKTIGKWMAVLVVMSWSYAVLANDQSYRLTSGTVNGTYHSVYGVNFRNLLREEGYPIEVVSSRGAMENLQRIHNGEADIGFTQGDVLGSFMRQNPTADIRMVGSIGQECLYLVTHKDSGIRRITDLKDSDISIAVGERGSGSAESMDFLRMLNADYRSPSIVYQGGVLAMGQVETGELGGFMWVASPTNRSHQFMQVALTNSDVFQFVDFNDRRIEAKLPGGRDVYTPHEVIGREGGRWSRDERIDTLCTDLLVVANYNTDAQLLETVGAAIMLNRSRLTSTP